MKHRLTIKNIEAFTTKDFGVCMCRITSTPDVYTFDFISMQTCDSVLKLHLERTPHHWDDDLGKFMYRYEDSSYVSAEWFNIDNAYRLFKTRLDNIFGKNHIKS